MGATSAMEILERQKRRRTRRERVQEAIENDVDRILAEHDEKTGA